MFTRPFLRFTAIVFALEIILLTLFSSPSYILNVMAREGVAAEDVLGTEALRQVDARASGIFADLLIDSGVYAGIWHTFVPTADERRSSEGLENLAAPLFHWVDDRLTAVMTLAFQLTERLCMMGLWMPFSLIIFAGALFSGLTLRRIKQGTFAFASPSVHRISIRIILVSLIFMPLFLMLPLPLSPYLYPVLFTVCAFMIMGIAANIAKRL